jgi:hypothetical protein
MFLVRGNSDNLGHSLDLSVALTIVIAALLGGAAPKLAVWHRVDLRPLLSKPTLSRHRHYQAGAHLALAVFALGGMASAYFLTEHLPHRSSWWRSDVVLVLWGMLCVSEGVKSLRVVYLASEDEDLVISLAAGPSDTAIERFRVLQGRTRLVLNTLGAGVTAVVILSGALLKGSESCIRSGPCRPLRASTAELTLSIGLVHAVVLALIYLPTQSRLDTLARRLATAWAPIHGTGAQLRQALETRASILAELKPTTGAREGLESGVVIAGPLIAAMVSVFVGG